MFLNLEICKKKPLKDFDKYEILVVVFAVAIQIQTSLFAQGDYLGIRVNLADILLPFTGIYVLYSLMARKSYWPKWNIPYMPAWLCALAVLVTVSFVRGIYVNGFISEWAFINKYIGFFILLAYLMLGSWIATNSRDYKKMAEIFILSFAAFFVLTIILSLFFTILHKYTGILVGLAVNPWSGFMGNRNALMVVAVLVGIYLAFEDKSHLERCVYGLYLFLLPFFFFYNASRTGWIVLAIILFSLLVKKPVLALKWGMPIMIVGAASCFLVAFVLDIKSPQGHDQFYHLTRLVSADQAEQEIKYIGDRKRMIAVEDGFELYTKTGSSLLGAGLGTYKPFQIEKRGEYIDVIDFTALWIFIEMGPVGLIVFTAFFCACLWGVSSKKFRNKDNQKMLYATACFLIAFAFMSLLHELLYTRILWLILGLSLATIAPKKL